MRSWLRWRARRRVDPRMTHRSSYLEIKVVWTDADLQEVVVSASSQAFSGRVNAYAAFGGLIDVADRIRGFPTGPTDQREFEVGQNLPGYGSAHVALLCRDATGHLIAQATLQTHAQEEPLGAESSVVHIAFVPADLDRFEQALRRIDGHVGARAVLATQP